MNPIKEKNCVEKTPSPISEFFILDIESKEVIYSTDGRPCNMWAINTPPNSPNNK
jgi:hypothetical protein